MEAACRANVKRCSVLVRTAYAAVMLASRKAAIEYRTIEVATAIAEGRSIEDDFVEVKSTWPDPDHRIARRIAGHANAARGEPFLWIFGADPDAATVAGIAAQRDMAEWWPQLEKRFDGVAPEPTPVAVPFGGVTLYAIEFSSDRAPYVVKVPPNAQGNHGAVSREVPWRSATRTNTAKREELLKILVPATRLPTIEILGGRLTQGNVSGVPVWTLETFLYVEPRGPVEFPVHRTLATLLQGESRTLRGHMMSSPGGAAGYSTGDTFATDRSCRLQVLAQGKGAEGFYFRPDEAVQATLELALVGSIHPIRVELELENRHSSAGNNAEWVR